MNMNMNMKKTKGITPKLLPFIICILGSFFYVYDYFLAVAPSVITHSLMQDFGLTATALGSLMAVFSLASTFFQIPAGVLLDRFGARKLLSLSVLISGIGAIVFAEAGSSWMLALARLLMGIGSPFAFLGALYLVSKWFSHRHFGFASGAIQLGAAAGSMIGGAPLAILVNHWGWRPALFGIGVGTIILSLLFWMILRDGNKNPESSNAHHTHTHTQPGSPLNSEHSSRSLWKTFQIPQVWWITLIGFCSWVTVTGLGSLWGVPYLMKIYAWSNAEAGGFYSLFWIGLGLGSPFIGWFSDRIHSRKIPFAVCFVLGILSCIFYMKGPAIPQYLMAFLLFFLGFVASTQSLTFAAAKDIVPHNHFVAISGLINLSAVFTGVIMQPLMGKIMDMHARTHGNLIPGPYLISDYQVSLIPILFFLALGLVVSIFGLKSISQSN
jgi:sugar phosphate permease